MNILEDINSYMENDAFVYILPFNRNKTDHPERSINMCKSVAKSNAKYLTVNFSVSSTGVISFNNISSGRFKANAYVVRSKYLTPIIDKLGYNLDILVSRGYLYAYICKGIDGKKSKDTIPPRSRTTPRIDDDSLDRNIVVKDSVDNICAEHSNLDKIQSRLSNAFKRRIKFNHPFVIDDKKYIAYACIKSRKILIDYERPGLSDVAIENRRRCIDSAFGSIGYKIYRITQEGYADKKFLSTFIQEIKDL